MLYESGVQPIREVIVAEHALKHGLTESQVRYAWDNYVAMQRRNAPDEDMIVAIGCEQTGRLMQMVAVERPNAIIICHAMAPPTRNVLNELGFRRR